MFFGGMLFGLLIVATVPRLLNLAIKPDKIYPLYGIHYSVQRAIVGLTNNRVFKTLFGDSSSIVHYLALPRISLTRRRADGVELRYAAQA